ncbi:hypothetical protein LX32DRAFT_763 [Colletotrichum zoysiae]|uniref:Uncharacterized protein n=1 Tax=Colletotrichum zoysiae TaxID=1216348 RepID=A0AAD9HUC0_9PEZI|nr:hypothetical protein LX32DRAFT_763 [Colletotrichum zoysiae]
MHGLSVSRIPLTFIRFGRRHGCRFRIRGCPQKGVSRSHRSEISAKKRNHISRKRDRVQSTWPSAQNLPRVIPRYTLLPRPGTRRQRSRGAGSIVVLCVRLLPRALEFTMSRGVEARNVIHRAPQQNACHDSTSIPSQCPEVRHDGGSPVKRRIFFLFAYMAHEACTWPVSRAHKGSKIARSECYLWQ